MLRLVENNKAFLIGGSGIALGFLVYKGFRMQMHALEEIAQAPPSYHDAVLRQPRNFQNASPSMNESPAPPAFNPRYENDLKIDDEGVDGQQLRRRQVLLQLTQTQTRITKTYLYLAAGLAMTAGSASLFAQLMIRNQTGLSPLLTSIATIASLLGIQFVSSDQMVLKHAMFTIFTSSLGATMAPLAMLSPQILGPATTLTTSIGVTLSLIAAASPSSSFLWMVGPLSAGLSGLTGVALAQYFWPTSPFLASVQLWGGLALYSGFMLTDTQRVRVNAERKTRYDCMTESLGIYLNVLNLFVRVVEVLLRQQQEQEKKKKEEQRRR